MSIFICSILDYLNHCKCDWERNKSFHFVLFFMFSLKLGHYLHVNLSLWTHSHILYSISATFSISLHGAYCTILLCYFYCRSRRQWNVRPKYTWFLRLIYYTYCIIQFKYCLVSWFIIFTVHRRRLTGSYLTH
jgi:hypothetical protein